MKQCPTCQSIVDEKTTCPICGETLTYIDPHPAHREKIARNRYGLCYYAKKAWFSCVCTAVVIVLLLCAESPRPNIVAVSALVCCLLSLVLSFFERTLARLWGEHLLSRDYHTDEYRKVSIGAEKYILAFTAVLIALISCVVHHS